MVTEDAEERAGTNGQRVNIPRGFLRLWIVLSLAWVLGVAIVNPFWKFGCNQIINCLVEAWEEAGLKAVPRVLPPNQKGLSVYELNRAQQTFMELPTKYLVHDNEYCDMLKEIGDVAYLKKVCYNTWWYSDPKRVRYKLYPIDKLASNEKEFVEGSIRDAGREFRRIVVVTFGVPLVFGAIGFAFIYAGRWIWSGFVSAGNRLRY